MTYPPQQPGQDNWGQQPGGWGQPQPGGHYPQSGPQQQWPQQGAQPAGGPQQPGGFPPSGPQQGWPQSGGFPQQSGQPQQPGYPQQPGFGAPGPQPGGFGDPYGGPPKKSKMPWIIGGIGGGVALLAVVGVVLVVALSGPGDPRPTAEEIVAKLNNKDFEGLASLSCAEDLKQNNGITDPVEFLKQEGVPEEQARALVDNMEFNVELASVEDHGDDTATVRYTGEMTMSMFGQTQTQQMNEEGTLIVENGSWVACDSAE